LYAHHLLLSHHACHCRAALTWSVRLALRAKIHASAGGLGSLLRRLGWRSRQAELDQAQARHLPWKKSSARWIAVVANPRPREAGALVVVRGRVDQVADDLLPGPAFRGGAPFVDSEELVRNSGLPATVLIEVGTNHRLADKEPLKRMLEACGGHLT
jgi:hypothetical protein